jgi:lipoyl(octanoyl) transferase
MPTESRPPPLSFRWLGRVTHEAALQLQYDLVDQRRTGAIGDTVLLLEHEPVYTIGRTPDKSSLNSEAGSKTASLPHPVVEISRGGQATYHGPGQLVGYPVLDLQHRGRDLHQYLRALESALIAFSRHLGAEANRRDGMTGVWVGPRKLASIGVGVRHWISLHGFAINITPESMSGFTAITPCGLPGVTMTCLAHETKAAPASVESAAREMQPHLASALNALR